MLRPTLAATAWMILALGASGCPGEERAPSAALSGASSVTPASPTAPVPAVATGTDADQPELAPEDRTFTDTRQGWGWSDRCWKNLHAGLLGYAKAECEAGLAMAPVSGTPEAARPSLLYNLGLIAEKSGNLIEARRLMEQSITLRSNDEVATALRRVGGTPPPTCEKCASQEDFDAAMKMGAKCCPVMACQHDVDCKGGRVCCKIPGGQLCGDAARCQGVNRVDR